MDLGLEPISLKFIGEFKEKAFRFFDHECIQYF
jgi:hypothetical protein